LLLTGRGWGKNLVESHFAHAKAAEHPTFAGFLAGRTIADVAKTIIGDTESGLLATQRPDNPCEFKRHEGRVVWANGAHADVHTSEEPDRARGGNYLWGVADEIGTW
jgi:phage terminase large subunit-like protein